MPFLKQEISWDETNPSSHNHAYQNVIKKIRHVSNPYLGNKKKLISFFSNVINKHHLKFKTFLDAFSGSAIVSLLMKSMGKKVLANDILSSSRSYAVALVENDDVILTNDEINFIVNKTNKNTSEFVQNNWTVQKESKINQPSFRRRFTSKEAEYLDRIKTNIDNLDCREKKALAFSSVFLLCMRLPFGFIDKSVDIYKHRKKQLELYGKQSGNHDRRIGIYYDENLNLDFDEWIPKYIRHLQSKIINNKNNKKNNKCFATSQDIIVLLNSFLSGVDCVYFDPPYGGIGSDYRSIYQFFEEYIQENTYENLPHDENMNRFVNKIGYETNFIEMLRSSVHIPIWLLSCNNSSWRGLNHIVSIVKRFKKKVIVESKPYQYRYRDKKNSKMDSEHIIIAT